MPAAEWLSPVSRRREALSLPSGMAIVVAVALLAWLDGVLAAPIGPMGAALLGIAAGVLIGRFLGQRHAVWVGIAFMPAAILLGTWLVPLDGRYLPILVVATALAAALGPDLLRHPGSLVFPTRPVIAVVAVYLAWFGVATLTSSSFRTSLGYVGGAIATLALVLVVIPTVLDRIDARRALVIALGLIGPILAIVGGAAAVAGPSALFGPAPRDLMFQMTVLGRVTPLVVPRITGVYYSPSYEAVALLVSILALLALLEAERTGRRLIQAAIAVSFLGLAATFDRNGLLALAVGSGVFSILVLMRRRVLGSAALVSIGAGALLLAMLLNVVGADLWSPPAATHAASPAAPNQQAQTQLGEAGDDIAVRGGSSLSGRDEIWRASVAAIEARPVSGWGPGTNPSAIAPYLTGAAARFVGLTSHDTWIRTAVELGLPGLLILLAFAAAILASVWRLVRGGSGGPFEIGFIAMFVGLISAFTFETFLLGGLSYGSVVWPLAAAMIMTAARGATTSSAARTRIRSSIGREDLGVRDRAAAASHREATRPVRCRRWDRHGRGTGQPA